MLAKASTTWPPDATGGGMWWEPKWDGFRCIVFRDGDEVEMQSRGGKSLTRYLPELVEPLRAAIPADCIVDGELVVVADGELNWDQMAQRVHPAASRVEMLSGATPATFVAFDLVAEAGDSLMDVPFVERRAALERLVKPVPNRVVITPCTSDSTLARQWFERFEGAGFDGVVGKPADGTYQPNKRVLTKLKHRRDIDVVVAGYRVHKDGVGVGSLLLGLFDDGGALHHIGVASSFSTAYRSELLDIVGQWRLAVDEVAKHPWASWTNVEAHGDGVRLPGAINRWSASKDHDFVPLRIGAVAEVSCDQVTAGRLRHPAKLLRWRTDKPAEACTFDQLDVDTPPELASLFD